MDVEKFNAGAPLLLDQLHGTWLLQYTTAPDVVSLLQAANPFLQVKRLLTSLISLWLVAILSTCCGMLSVCTLVKGVELDVCSLASKTNLQCAYLSLEARICALSMFLSKRLSWSRLGKCIRVSIVKEEQMVGWLKTLCDGACQDFYRFVDCLRMCFLFVNFAFYQLCH